MTAARSDAAANISAVGPVASFVAFTSTPSSSSALHDHRVPEAAASVRGVRAEYRTAALARP